MLDFGARERESLEVLAGDRPRARRQAAVRIEDIAPLLELAPLQATKAAGSTPTQAEYDALVVDMQRMHARLTAIADLLRARVL
jgi:hypothetical protein